MKRLYSAYSSSSATYTVWNIVLAVNNVLWIAVTDSCIA
jgi:hypothetical protein